MIELRDYQREAVDKCKAILQQRMIVYLAGEIRVGKNFCSFFTAIECGWRNVCLITKKGAIEGVEKDYQQVKHLFQLKITNYEMAHKLINIYDGFIIDEAHSCFPGGTLIDGRKIEDIELGDSLKSYNFDKGEREDDVVVGKKEITNTNGWVRIIVNGKEIICTPDHLFYSKRGWIKACEITTDDELFTMQ